MDEFKLFQGKRFKSISKEETIKLFNERTKEAYDKIFENVYVFMQVAHIEKDHRKGGFFRQNKRVCIIAEI